jgi:TonB family protein
LGHREGTDSIDARLAHLQVTTLSKPSDVVDPEELGPSPKAERTFLSLNPALPTQAGGNGLSRGTGKDPALGTGGLMRPPTTVPVRDLQLVPTKQVQVYHSLARGESATPQQPVRIRILIGEDGVPYEASVVSGPPFLYQEALKAARGWRFEPLAKHGLKAPISIVLTFYPSLQPLTTYRAN